MSVHVYAPRLSRHEHVPARAGSARAHRHRRRLGWTGERTDTRPQRARSIDELLAEARGAHRPGHAPRRWPPGWPPARCWSTPGPAEQRSRDGAVPGAVVVDRNVLEWRLDPASPTPPEVTGYDLEVVVLCNEGYSSSLVADTLRALGLTRAVDVIGGFDAWAAAGPDPRPAVTEDGAVAA